MVKNYRGIPLTFIATKTYHALLRNRIEPKIDNILRKNQMASEEIYQRLIHDWPPCQCTQNLIYVLKPNWRHFHTRRNISGTSRQIHLPRKQRLINRKRHRPKTNESMDSDRFSIIWKSDLTDKMKRSFFQAAVVSILLYGCTTWTITKRLKKKLDGNYTRMLRAILNKSWRQHPTRHQLYGQLPLITKTIQVRRTRHAGHCWRSKDELNSDVLLWTPTYGQAKSWRLARTYIQQLCEETGCIPDDLPEAMNDREKWRERVRDIRAGGMTWCWWWWWLLH